MEAACPHIFDHNLVLINTIIGSYLKAVAQLDCHAFVFLVPRQFSLNCWKVRSLDHLLPQKKGPAVGPKPHRPQMH